MAETSTTIDGFSYDARQQPSGAVERARHPKSERRFLPVSSAERLTSLTIWICLLFMPILFGSVHNRTEVSFQLLVLGAFFYCLAKERKAIFDLLTNCKYTQKVFGLLIFFLIYSAAQYLFLKTQKVPHPILGMVSGAYNTEAFFRSFKATLFFTASFLLICYYLQRAKSNINALIARGLWCFALVGAVGLMHWLYDNGKLFWVFAPDFAEPSTRARWPFVSPNNFGHFTLLGVFLCIGVFINQLRAILIAIRDEPMSVSSYVASSSFQRSVFRLALFGLGMIVLGSGLLGSLSRGSWLGGSLGLIFFLVCGTLITEVTQPDSTPDNLRHLHDYSRRKRHPSRFRRLLQSSFVSSTIRHSRMLVLLASFLLIYMFLSDRGAELLTERLDYGLLSSKYDMRWQLFSDTLQMISDHTFWGVGLGAWASAYPPYMNSLLAGINPIYLHSDPLQLLAEVGAVGFLPMFVLVLITCTHAIRYLRSYVTHEDKVLVLSLSSALFALCVASFLDFPFKIPAISFYVAFLLAILASKLDGRISEHRN